VAVKGVSGGIPPDYLDKDRRMAYEEMDLSKVKTYPFEERPRKVSVDQFAQVYQPDEGFRRFLSSLPHILVGQDFRTVVQNIVRSHRMGRTVMVMMGAHVIKCGLSPIVIDLMERGIFSSVALNGGGSIHDFEIAFFGKTSEDVLDGLRSGQFGFSEETGRWMNGAIRDGAREKRGMGEALGRAIDGENAPYRTYSILWNGHRLNRPVTVHVGVGTDIIHQHPEADGAAIGETSYRDFKRLVSVVSTLDGGVVINLGSAVVLPEVFLKALSVARNLGYPATGFTAVNVDMIMQYRAIMNVVQRPTAGVAGGYSLIGRHELVIPLLAAAVKSELGAEG
jgi:hypothetical protein